VREVWDYELVRQLRKGVRERVGEVKMLGNSNTQTKKSPLDPIASLTHDVV